MGASKHDALGEAACEAEEDSRFYMQIASIYFEAGRDGTGKGAQELRHAGRHRRMTAKIGRVSFIRFST